MQMKTTQLRIAQSARWTCPRFFLLFFLPLLLLLPSAASAQGTTTYPTAVDDAVSLPVPVDAKVATLTVALTSIATTATVNSTTGFPSAGLFIIESETVAYTGTTSTTFTGLTRGFAGTNARPHTLNMQIRSGILSAHITAARGATIAMETKLGTGASNASDAPTGNVLTKRGDGTTGWDFGAGTGDVVGPASSVNNRIVLFNGTSGKAVKDSSVLIADLQPVDADLTAIAALTPSNDDVLQRKAGDWTNRTIAQLKSDFSLATIATSGSASDLSGGTVAAARMPSLTGDIATSSGAVATTLATVNSNVGTFGSATQASQVTVNGKGLVTAASNVTVIPAVGSVSGLGTGVATALGVNVGSAGAPLVNGGVLGTPSSGVATNLTGTASGLTAGNVTTNANLTGDVTSVGNATAIAAGVIVNADVNASAAIAYSKLALTGAIVNADITNSTIDLTAKVTGILPAANGGTGINNSTRTLTVNTNAGTLAFGAASKTLTINNSLALSGTDATVMTFPSTSATIARTDAANTFTGVQTMTSPAITTPAFTGTWTGTYTIGGTPTLGAATWSGTQSAGGNQLNNVVIGTSSPLAGTFTTGVFGSTTSLLLGTAGSAVGNIGFRNATSGTITLAPVAGALGTVTLTLPARTDTLVTLAGTEALTNKTYNGNTFTAGTGVLTIAAGKTLTANNSITLAGTDSTTMTFPSTSATLARTDAANTFTGHQTIEGVTSTGATGSGKFVFDTLPQVSAMGVGVANSTTGTLLIQGPDTAYSGKAFRVTNSATTALFSITDDGRVFIGADTGFGAPLVITTPATGLQSGTSISAILTDLSQTGSPSLKFQAFANRFTLARGEATGTLTFGNSAVNDQQISLNVATGVTTFSASPVAPGATLNALGSDATHTDNTVCADTASGVLYKGSGTLGICLGTSSARFKNHLSPIKGGLDELLALKPKSFFYNTGYGDGGARLQYGFTAEDVAKVMPELVGNDTKGRPNTVDMLGMFPKAILAIQQLNARITALEQEHQRMRRVRNEPK